MNVQKKIIIFGFGGRVRNCILPALNKIDSLNISQIVTTKSRNIYLKEFDVHINTVVFKDIRLEDIDLIYLAIPTRSIIKTIKKLIQTYDVSSKIIIVDTPPLNLLNLIKLRYFKKFKASYVLEDIPYTPVNQAISNIIKEKRIGTVERINLYHNAFNYHAFAHIKKLLNINSFDFIYKKRITKSHAEIRIYKGIKSIAVIHEPRDYSIGRTLIIGSNGQINDYEMHIKNPENNFTIHHEYHSALYRGFYLYKNNKLYSSHILKKEELLNPNLNIQEQIYDIQKILGVVNYFKILLLSLDSKNKNLNLYSIQEGVYDYLISSLLPIRIIFDINVPFINKSILNLLINQISRL